MAHGLRQVVVHALERAQQLARFVAVAGVDMTAEIARGHGFGDRQRIGQRPGDAARNHQRQRYADARRQHQHH